MSITMKRIITILTAVLMYMSLQAQTPQLRVEVFDLIDLDHPGLETVKSLHAEGNDTSAAQALLEYYRNRIGILTPEIKDVRKVKINK